LDDAIADGLYDRISLITGGWSMRDYEPTVTGWRQWLLDTYGEDADEELFCIPSQGAKNYFTTAMMRLVMKSDVRPIEFQRDKEYTLKTDKFRERDALRFCKNEILPTLKSMSSHAAFLGADFARSVNLSVFWLIQETEDADLAVRLAVEIWNVPFRQQEQILFYICDNVPFFAGGALDARGNGQAMAEFALQRYGRRRIIQVQLSDKFYSKHFPIYKDLIINNEISLPKSPGVLDDHRAIKRINGIPKIDDAAASKSHKTGQHVKGMIRHGDSAIAGLLASHAALTIQPHRTIKTAKIFSNRD